MAVSVLRMTVLYIESLNFTKPRIIQLQITLELIRYRICEDLDEYHNQN